MHEKYSLSFYPIILTFETVTEKPCIERERGRLGGISLVREHCCYVLNSKWHSHEQRTVFSCAVLVRQIFGSK